MRTTSPFPTGWHGSRRTSPGPPARRPSSPTGRASGTGGASCRGVSRCEPPAVASARRISSTGSRRTTSPPWLPATRSRQRPFDPSYRIHPDHDHAFRLFARAHVSYLDEPVFRYRRHDDNITADQLGARLELIHTLERLRREDAAAVQTIGPRRLEDALARHYYRIGRTRLRLGEAAAARAAFDRAVALAPLRPAYRWRRWRAG